MTGRLAGKRAFVTGGGSGIGAEVVRRFRAEGAAVISADLAAGDVVCDVRSGTSVRAAIDRAATELGGIDTVILNAGRPVVGTVHELSEADWDDGIATNLTSLYHCSRAAWPHLVAAGGGSISITASIVGLWGSQNQAAYCATKAAAVMLAKCMALDGAKDGVRANCVCPGFTQTPMLDRFVAVQADPQAVLAGATALHPLGRLGTPDDIASAFVYLASDDARWVTGTVLTVDGGLTAGVWGG